MIFVRLNKAGEKVHCSTLKRSKGLAVICFLLPKMETCVFLQECRHGCPSLQEHQESLCPAEVREKQSRSEPQQAENVAMNEERSLSHNIPIADKISPSAYFFASEAVWEFRLHQDAYGS